MGRTAAFRSRHRVGFGCPVCTEQLSYGPPLYSFRGSITRPGVLLPPAPYSPCEVCTRRSLLPCWLGFREVGIESENSHPLGNNDLFHGFTSTPEVSGFAWREERVVRRELPPQPQAGAPAHVPLPTSAHCAPCLTRFFCTISGLNVNTWGSLRSTTPRTHWTSGHPKTSTRVKCSIRRCVVVLKSGLSMRK
jgi:hypothetical protein